MIDSVVANPLGIGIIGLLIATYSGIGWMGNLRKATRAIWRPEFEEDKSKVDNFVLATVKDLGSLAGLGVAIVVSLGLSTFGSQFATQVLDWLGLGDQPWLGAGGHRHHVADRDGRRRVDLPLGLHGAAREGTAVPVQGAVARVDPGRGGLRDPQVRADRAAARCATGSKTAAVFGPVIGLLFFFNLVAQMVLFVAAWIATAEGGPELDDGPLPEVPEATLIVRKDRSTTRSAALVGVGAAVGWGAARRRR